MSPIQLVLHRCYQLQLACVATERPLNNKNNMATLIKNPKNAYAIKKHAEKIVILLIVWKKVILVIKHKTLLICVLALLLVM